jgi:diaminopimelate decarboxylase
MHEIASVHNGQADVPGSSDVKVTEIEKLVSDVVHDNASTEPVDEINEANDSHLVIDDQTVDIDTSGSSPVENTVSNQNSLIDSASLDTMIALSEVDGVMEKNGSSTDNRDFLAPKMIKDPCQSKLADCVDAAEVDDQCKVTFDNADELLKIEEHLPPDDSGPDRRFGVKFGAPLVHVRGLLTLTSELKLKIIGTSFHIGSGCFDTQSYEKAVASCRSVFDMGAALGLSRFTFVDLGGGFPGNPVENEDTGLVPAFEKLASAIHTSLATRFHGNVHGDVRVIAEPGRYMATRYSTLFTHVQAKREEPADPSDPLSSRKFLYYINDGVYGSLNCIMLDHAHPEPVPAYRFKKDRLGLDRRGKTTYQPTSSNGSDISLGHAELPYMSARGMHSSSKRDQNCAATVFDATCNSMDMIVKYFPVREWFVGDWLAFASMGVGGTNDSIYFNHLLSNDLCTLAETVLIIATDHGPVVTSTLDAISCARADKSLISPLARKRMTDDDNVKLVSTPVYGPFHKPYRAKPSGADIWPVDPSLALGRDIDRSLKNRVALVVPPNLVTMSLLGVSLTRATVVNDAGLDPPVASSPHPSHALYSRVPALEVDVENEATPNPRVEDVSTNLDVTPGTTDISCQVAQAKKDHYPGAATCSDHNEVFDSVTNFAEIVPRARVYSDVRSISVISATDSSPGQLIGTGVSVVRDAILADGTRDGKLIDRSLLTDCLQRNLAGYFDHCGTQVINSFTKSTMMFMSLISYQYYVLLTRLMVNSTAALYPGLNSGGEIVTAVPSLGHH